ncbi:hypothetical protein NKH09_29975 [Mesorhizobium sp. M1339]|uniref:hypothetical protein n=1 Tax=Mesorhizobium sp. M1339 TaxID=2957086 RepID=UPI003338DEC9
MEKIALGEDADGLSFRYQRFRFEMLAALRLTVRDESHPIAQDKPRGIIPEAAIHFAAGMGRQVGPPRVVAPT